MGESSSSDSSTLALSHLNLSMDCVIPAPSSPPQCIQSLINWVNEIAEISDYRKTQKKDCLTIVRRIQLLMPLFEELKDMGSLPEDVLSCIASLEKTLQSAKALLQLCHEGSKLYLVLEGEAIAGRFRDLTEELDQALDDLPYNLLKVSDEVREQVELMHLQLKRSKGRADTQDIELFMDIMIALSHKEGGTADSAVVERLADRLQLSSVSDLIMESRAVEKLMKEKDGNMGETAENIIYLLKKMKGIREVGNLEGDKNAVGSLSLSETCSETTPTVPEDFRCPISLDLMKDPVIVATGQTYDRSSIQKWFDTGHQTCPKTQQVLPHLTLTPNYVLRSLIVQWCEKHGVEVPSRAGPSGSGTSNNSSDIPLEYQRGIDILVQKLSCRQTDVQRTAAEEIRLLAKRNADNRLLIAEAGAIPHLVKLLSSSDVKTQEHAVTALLNLSIHSSNKGLIVQAGAISYIIEVLKHGSMEARENAAATLFSLSVVDENKITIGASGAIPPLVDLLRDGTPRGKKDAATALFNLCIYQGNKARAVRAGVVPPLMELIVDQSIGMVDEALAILAILATHQEGRIAIGKQSAIHILVDLIHLGSARNKENAAAVLLALGINDSSHLLTALQLGVYNDLVELAQNGTARARRKARTLLDLVSKQEHVP